MQALGNTRYLCDTCTSTRLYNITRESHENAIKNSSNGLVTYSDIHRCKNGFLGINNLHVDHNYSVRSLEHLILPSEKRYKKASPGLPMPVAKAEKINKVAITEMLPEGKGFRLIILDHDLGINLNLGKVKDKEIPIKSFKSRFGGIDLSFYKSDQDLDENIENWLIELINLLEELPPTKVGLFIETLRYIYSLRKIGPAKFHLNMLHTILTSHKIHIDLVTRPPNFELVETKFKEVYGSETVDMMSKLLIYIDLNPNTPLHKYTQSNHEDMSFLIYLFLILEQEQLIQINRPVLV